VLLNEAIVAAVSRARPTAATITHVIIVLLTTAVAVDVCVVMRH